MNLGYQTVAAVGDTINVVCELILIGGINQWELVESSMYVNFFSLVSYHTNHIKQSEPGF